MTNFRIEIATEGTYNAIWDGDAIADPIEAETEEEAIELAKQYLLDNGCTEEEVENTLFRATEK